MADIYTLLSNARSADNNTRNAAENALLQFEQAKPGEYFLSLSHELRNEARPDDVRQMAGLRMKVSLDAQDYTLKQERQARWSAIPADQRKVVKDNVTATIGAAGDLARRAAAQVIAKIGFIEITPEHNEWQELLPGLVSTATREELPAEPRSTALTALAYLLEELDAYDESPMEQTQVDHVLTAICRCMQLASPKLLQIAAGQAMLNTLPFVASNFEAPERVSERDAIMMAICTATTSEEITVKRTAFACLEKVAELYYAYLGSYMKVLADLTAVAARHADEHVAVSAIGFWSEIADAEADKGTEDLSNHKFTQQALVPLVEMLTDIMSASLKESDGLGDDTDEYGPAEAAQTCLRNVAGAVADAIVDPVMRFINANFISPDWRKRDAALMAFGLIMVGPEPQSLQQRYIKDVLPHVFARLKGGSGVDPSVTVRSSAAFVLAEIFEHHFEVMDLKTAFVPAVTALCGGLDDEPVVVKQVTRALDNLVTSAKETDGWEAGKGSVLSPILFQTINQLMVRAEKPDAEDSTVPTDCYEVITTIVDGGTEADQQVLLSLLADSLKRIQASLARLAAAPSAAARQTETEHQEVLVGLACDIMLNVQEAALPQSDTVIGAMIAILDSRTATAEAWRGVSSIISVMPTGDSGRPAGAAAAAVPTATRYTEALWPRLLAALAQPSDAATCSAAVNAASSIARALLQDLAPKAAQLLTGLINLLSDNMVERDIKPPALAALGDVAFALGVGVQPYLHTMHAVVLGAAGVVLSDDDDEDLAEYVADIRTTCLDAWTNMVAAFLPEDNNPASKAAAQQAALGMLSNLQPSTPGAPPSNLVTDVLSVLGGWLGGWMKDSQDSGDEPPFEQLKKAVSLLGDLGLAVGPNALQALQVTARNPVIDWALRTCTKMEQEAAAENGENLKAADTQAGYAKKQIPK